MASTILDNPVIRERLLPLTVTRYQSFCRAGVIEENTELLEGYVFKKMTKSATHSFYADVFYEAIRQIIPPGSIIRSEKPLSLENSEPEPDISVVEGPLAKYAQENPSTALLVVEISRSSLQYDREKARVYARAGVESFMIVNLIEQCVEFYREPGDDGYALKKTFHRDEEIPLFNQSLALSAIFGSN